MAKKISSSDLFEQEDLFKGIRDSATKTIEVLKQVQGDIVNNAKQIQDTIKNSSTDSTKGLKEFSDAAAAASKIMADSAVVSEKLAKAEQQRIKADQEIIKLNKLKAQEADREAKATEKQAAAAAKLAREQEKEVGTLNKLEAANKKLRAERQQLDLETSKGQQRLREINAELDKNNKFIKENSDALKQQKLNVGNYAGALEGLEQQVAEGNMTMRQMSQAIKQFQTIALQAGETSPVGKQAIANAAALKDRLGDLSNRTKLLASDTVKLDTALAGIGVGAAAFQGLQGAMALAGGESEALQKAMVKLQAVQMVSNSIQQIANALNKDSILGIQLRVGLEKIKSFVIGESTSATVTNTAATTVATTATEAQGVATVATTAATRGATVAMKALRVALITSGIGAIVVVLGLAADAMGLFSDKTKEEEKAQKDLERQTKRLEEAIESYNRATQAVIQTIDNATRSELALARQRGASQKELTAITKQGAEDRLRILKSENEELKKEYLRFSKSGTREQFEKAEKAYLESAQKVRDAQIRIQEIDADIAEQSRQSSQSFVQSKTKTVNEIVDLYDKILDEQIKAINDEDQRAQTQLIVEADRRKKEIQKTVADKKQKAELIKLIELNLIADLDKLDKEYFEKKQKEEEERLEKERERTKKLAEQAEWLYNYKKELAEKERQENIKLYNETVQFENKQNQAKLASLTGRQKEEFKERLEFWDELEKLNQLKQDGAFESQEDYEKAVANLKKEYNKVAQELEAEKWKTTQEFAQKTTDFLKEQSEKRIKQIDKEISAAEKQADFYRELAANGNIDAQQSLAEQERIIAESNRRKEREQKKQQRMELANTIYQTYSGHAAKDPDTALMKTIKDASLLQAFISSLPMFYDGTEDTGKGGGLDGKGGFHAVLHPHERVIPKSLNDQIGSLTNEQLTRLAMEYNNGRLVGKDVAHSSMDLAILVNKLDNLTEVIKQKPETNIELGEITQSAMEIVRSTRKGNTTVYNRFKVRS